MKNNTTFILIGACIAMIVFALLLALKVQKKNTSIIQQPQRATQKSDEANVIVTVKPEVLQIGEKPRFFLEFNTHSVELDFDVTHVSSIVDDDGKIYAASIWDGTPPGGHHRTGTVTYNAALQETSKVRFILTDISGVNERVFEWSL